MPGLFDVENGVVTDPAVVVIFEQMNIMAEEHRIGAFELEQYVFRFLCECGSRGMQSDQECQQGDA
jgi:hypothetical protein